MSAGRPPLSISALHGQRVDLTPLDPAADAVALHAMLGDPAVHRYDAAGRPSTSVAETEARLRRQLAANGGASWAIRVRGGDAIGTIGVFADQGTTIRGVGWSLAPSYWRHGIASEAARMAVPYLLAQPGVDGLEAWVDSRNAASLGVARAAGMSERGRLPLVYDDEVAQTIVMARAAVPQDPEVLAAVATLQVGDLATTTTILTSVLSLSLAWAVPDPPVLAFLAVAPWSGSPGFQLEQAAGPVAAGRLALEVGISVDAIRDRVVAAGLLVVAEPANQPWNRREMSFRLPEGHLVVLSGPTSPAGRP